MKMFSHLKKAAYEFALAASLVCLSVSNGIAKLSSDITTVLTRANTPETFVHKSSAAAPVAVQLVAPSSHADKLAQTFSQALINGTRVDKNGQPKAMNASNGNCVAHTRNAYRKVGIDIGNGYAKDFKASLPRKGFKIVPLDNYTPQVGDFSIILPNGPHADGHIGAFAQTPGKKPEKKKQAVRHNASSSHWASDFVQRDVWPYREKRNNNLIVILRHEKFEKANKARNEKIWRFANSSYLVMSRAAETGDYFESPYVGNFLGFRQEQMIIASLAAKSKGLPVPANAAPAFSPKIAYDSVSLLAMADTPEQAKQHQKSPLEEIGGIAVSLASLSSRRVRVNNSPDNDPQSLHDQWHAARKAVLMRNKALAKGNVDAYADKKLRGSVTAMNVCLPAVMKSDVVEAFKAARYVFNKMDDTSLFGARRHSKDKRAVLSLMATHMDTLAAHDRQLSAQMARFVAANTKDKKLRVQMLAHLGKRDASIG